jgi:hypothetical protein
VRDVGTSSVLELVGAVKLLDGMMYPLEEGPAGLDAVAELLADMVYPLEDGPRGKVTVMTAGTVPVTEFGSVAKLPDGTIYPLDNEPVEMTPGDVGTASVLLLDGAVGPEGTGTGVEGAPGLPELAPDEGVLGEVGTASVLLAGEVAELPVTVEPGYDMDETIELPGFMGAEFVYDETNKLPGGARYPLEEPMELGPADEAG